MGQIRVLSAEQSKDVLSMEDVIGAVSSVYSEKARENTVVWPLVFYEFEPGVSDMDIKSGWVKGEKVFGLKLVSWYGENAKKGLPMLAGTVLVCDDETGMPVGILNGSYMTGIRTGAAGALGAKYLAREDSENLLIVGAGHVASFQIAATLILMPQIKKVRIYDALSFDGAKNLANNIGHILKEELNMELPGGVEFEAVENIEAATGASDVIITVTPSRKPIIMKEWVKPGTHFSCIGADMSGKQEIDGNILATARIFVDDLNQNISVGEIEIPIKEGLVKPEDVVGELGHVIIGEKQGRENDDQITVYDATGTALLDIIVGKLALDVAKKKNVGSVVEL